ncbi:MAG: tetratricopeptide repeat protein [Planctomycetota bacterium]|nr:tetratricopeptide repeat protein [Planctomycetota bacterium]
MRRALAILLGAAVVVLVWPVAGRAGIGIGTIEEDPRVTHEKWKRKAEDDYKTGMEARAAGKKAEAVKYLIRAYDIGRRMRIDSPYPQKAADALAELTREGLRELDVARDLVAGEAPQAGILELKRITRTYLGLTPARQSGSLMRQLEGDAGFQARLRRGRLAEQLARAEALEARAAALEPAAEAAGDSEPPNETPAAGTSPGASALGSGAEPEAAEPEPAEPAVEAAGNPDPPGETHNAARPSPGASAPGSNGVEAADVNSRTLTKAQRRGRRLDLLAEAHAIYARVAEMGKGTEVGKKAEAARRRLEQDAGLMVRIRRARLRDQAREWLGLGTNYMRAGRMDKARAYFEKIVAECPDTPQARQARGFLDGMKE